LNDEMILQVQISYLDSLSAELKGKQKKMEKQK